MMNEVGELRLRRRNQVEEKMIVELKPTNGRKSFYGKATVKIDSDGTQTLFSYGTPIMKRNPDGTLIRLWDSWSHTTGCHIKAFCGLNKSEYENL